MPAPSRRYFNSKSGQLAALKLSDSLEQTMWAAAMVGGSSGCSSVWRCC
jgi:hypothetical protein